MAGTERGVHRVCCHGYIRKPRDGISRHVRSIEIQEMGKAGVNYGGRI